MREIKFRAWGQTGTHPNRMAMHYFDFHFGAVEWGKSEHVMQYTGLKDKNGRECYESDIVRYDPFNREGVFEWVKNGFWIVEPDGTRFLPRHFEIIGNVYENERSTK